MSETPDRALFEKVYEGTPPWETGRPAEMLVAAADQVVGPVLDAGCGTGENALFFAARGLKVTGIDFVEAAIRKAREKAVERGLTVDFRMMDALMLAEWTERFRSVIDAGLFHVFFSDADRARYVAGLAHVLELGGRLFLVCFSDAEPGTTGPRRVSERELRETFAEGWEVESIAAVQGYVNPEFTGAVFSEGGPRCWFAVIRRTV